jgi:hypothetical protein
MLAHQAASSGVQKTSDIQGHWETGAMKQTSERDKEDSDSSEERRVENSNIAPAVAAGDSFKPQSLIGKRWARHLQSLRIGGVVFGLSRHRIVAVLMADADLSRKQARRLVQTSFPNHPRDTTWASEVIGKAGN